MALKALMLRKKIDQKKKELEGLRSVDFATREADLAKAIEEAETDEERSAVESEIDSFESDKKANADAVTDLERELGELEEQLAEEERAQNTDPVKEPEEERKGVKDMPTVENRNRFGVSEEFVTRENVAEFLLRVRDHMSQKRALTNVGLTIPTEIIGLIRENVMRYSKLYRHVNTRYISGEGRMIVQGTVPEAVWTECCANLNELTLTFNDVEVDCNKLGGYFAVCNAVLQDSDIDLASALIEALSQAIGYALDKAILYGTGTKMPLGVVARLAQTQQPADYPSTARTWVDLHTSNIKTISSSAEDAALFKQIILDSGAAKSAYSRGEKTWVMNEATHTTLIANAMAVNSSGAIVAGVNGAMPVIGGDIEVLNFVPDNVIVGGYFDLYLLAERSGANIAQSEHVRFIEDQTVFKGTARYDGAPVIAEGFVAIGINGTTPAANVTFATDTANT